MRYLRRMVLLSGASSVNQGQAEGWGRWQGLVEGIKLFPKCHVQQLKGTDTAGDARYLFDPGKHLQTFLPLQV